MIRRTDTLRGTLTRPANTTQYTAADVMSAVTSNDHFTFSPASYGGELSGRITSCRSMIQANQATKPDLELWLFHTDIAEVADNAAFAPTDTEILTLVDVILIPVASWLVGLSGAGAAGNIIQRADDLKIDYRTGSTRALYGQLVVRNTYTPIASEVVTVDLEVVLDA